MKIKLIVLILVLCVAGCKTSMVPKVKLSQFPSNAITASYAVEGRKLRFDFGNELFSPVRIHIHSEDTLVLNHFDENPIIIRSGKDTSFQITLPAHYDPKITFSSALGDPSRKVVLNNISLPIKKDTQVGIIQGYNGSYSHNHDYSRYAIDFNIKENDTIYAATNGVVIGVIKDYIHGGPGEEWKGFDNFITIYDPESGLYTQYVHLVHQGNLVNIGDFIKQGDPVGLSGKTGYTGSAHLHFNTLAPIDGGGITSVPVNFKEGYKGEDLRKGQRVIKPGVKEITEKIN